MATDNQAVSQQKETVLLAFDISNWKQPEIWKEKSPEQLSGIFEVYASMIQCKEDAEDISDKLGDAITKILHSANTNDAVELISLIDTLNELNRMFVKCSRI